MLHLLKQLSGLEADPTVDIVEVINPKQDQREDCRSQQNAFGIEIGGRAVGLAWYQRLTSFMRAAHAEGHHQKCRHHPEQQKNRKRRCPFH